MRRAARTDTNQTAIVAYLRANGCTVQSLAATGKGCPDLLVGWRCVNVLLEVKDGDRPPSERRLTPDQKAWHLSWRGQVAVVDSPEAAWQAVRDAFAGRTTTEEGK